MAADIGTKEPTECVLWKTEVLTIEQLREVLDLVTTYEDDSHLIRKLLRCRECGHLYFREFYEEIDWQEGKVRNTARGYRLTTWRAQRT